MKFPAIFLLSILFCGTSAARLNTNWWKSTEIYDIVVMAYKDSDGDGFGDFEGIISKLDYVKSLGVHTIKLSPIFASSEEITNTYPIEDFQNTHLAAGSLEDFDKLVKEAKARGIRILMDLIINHCSLQHEWFKKSQNRIEPFTNYFVWADKGQDKDIFDDGAYDVWTWDETRKQYFYHRFKDTTADLNLRSEAVKNEIKNLMKFWLDRGVSGFNLLSANAYIEDEKAKQYENPSLKMLEDNPESYEFVHELRKYLDNYNEKKGGDERVLILEKRPIEKFPNLRGSQEYPIAHIVSQNFFQRKKNDYYFVYFQSSYINQTITNIMTELKNGPAMYILEDTTLVRTPNRFLDRQYVDVWMTTILTLPGIIHIYYGQEIGISTWKFAQQLKVTAMQWDGSTNAGFTSSELLFYTPNVDYWKVNVEDFQITGRNTLKCMQDLVKLRETKTVQQGDLKTYNVNDYVFAFSRSYPNQGKLLTILNLSNELYTCNLQRDIPEFTSEKGQIVSSTPNSIHYPGESVSRKSQLTMRPVSAVVISFNK